MNIQMDRWVIDGRMYAGLVVYLVFIIFGAEVRVELSGIAGVGSCWEG